MSDEPNRTVHAQQAFEFTDLFGYKFGPKIYGEATPRRLRLMEPDGPSTAGGKQARQSLMLQPDEGEQKLVCGWIDVTQKTAELKSFNTIRDQHKARFGQKLDLPKEEYERLLKELISFLNIQRIEHRVLEGAPRVSQPAVQTQAPSQTALQPMPIAIALVAGIGMGIMIGYLLFGGPG